MLRSDVELLKLVQRAAAVNPEGEARVSKRDVAAELGVSSFRVYAGFGRLEQAGLIASEARFDEAGGQLPNAIRLTSAGECLLRAIGEYSSDLLGDAYARREVDWSSN